MLFSTGCDMPDDCCSRVTAATTVDRKMQCGWDRALITILRRSILTRSAHLSRLSPPWLPHTTSKGVEGGRENFCRMAVLLLRWRESICSIDALENLTLYMALALRTALATYVAPSAVLVRDRRQRVNCVSSRARSSSGPEKSPNVFW